MMKKLMVYNVKGGSGKSTTAQTLSRGFALKGFKTLCIDNDPQANTSKLMREKALDMNELKSDLLSANMKDKEAFFLENYMKQRFDHGIHEVYDDPASIQAVIQRTHFENLDILPANMNLYLTDSDLRMSDGRRENKLRKALSHIRNQYNFSVIDCSPVKSLLTVNALLCEPLVIIPVDFSDDSLQGAALTINEINTLKNEYDELEDVDYRIVLTKRHDRMKSHQCTEELLRYFFGEKVLRSVIRYQAAPIMKATQERRTILDAAPNSKICKDYWSLINELEELL